LILQDLNFNLAFFVGVKTARDFELVNIANSKSVYFIYSCIL